MSWLRFFRRRYWDNERRLELESYLAAEIDDQIARGASLEDARRAAHRKLGNPTLIREEIYQMNTIGVLETLWQDVRYGFRLLRRNPTFAIVAILTLALGTGANTAIFQLVDAVRLRALPVDHPEQLAEVRIVKAPNGRTGSFLGPWPMLSYPLYLKIKEQQHVFADFMAWGGISVDLAQGGERRSAQALWVTGNFFSMLGIGAERGRVLGKQDEHAPVAMVNDLFWRNRAFHVGYADGTDRWIAKEGRLVSSNFNFLRIFAGDSGVIYGLTSSGDLYRFRHEGRSTGTNQWTDPQGMKIASNWNYLNGFSSGDGIIYAMTPDQRLLWFRDDGRDTNTINWASPDGKVVGVGWNVKTIFSGTALEP